MLDLNQEQALIVSALVNQAITGLDDELFEADAYAEYDMELDLLDALETEMFLLEDLQLKLDEIVMENVYI